MKLISKKNFYFITFLIALAAMLGSLYFSEVEFLTPCVLCWYQRIVMYPITILALVGLIKRDAGLPHYVLPLTIIGLIISGYHYMIQMVKPAAENLLVNCEKGGVSCSTIDITYFGFVTIPLLSFMAFAAITIFMIMSLRTRRW